MESVVFGPFSLIATERRLERSGAPVQIGSRAFDILIALVERAGAVVTKSELLARAWPELNVEETNLRTNIAGLRKALGEGENGARYIANVAGRGYCFVGRIVRRSVPGQRVLIARSSPPAVESLDARLVEQLLASHHFSTALQAAVEAALRQVLDAAADDDRAIAPCPARTSLKACERPPQPG